MIGYRGGQVVLTAEKYKDYIVSVEDIYIHPVVQASFREFTKYDNTPEVYDDVYIGDYTISVSGLLADCHNFNHNVHIGNNVTDISQLLLNCTSFNQNLFIPKNVTMCTWALKDCTNFSSHVFFNHTTNEDMGIYFALEVFYNVALTKYIHTTTTFSEVLKNKWLMNRQEVLSWTPLSDKNGWYNSQYDLFLYNNYIPS